MSLTLSQEPPSLGCFHSRAASHRSFRPGSAVILRGMSTVTGTLALYEQTGAYLRGHFRLTSGLHSGEYLQSAKVLAHPRHAEHLGRLLAERVQPLLDGESVDFVIAPAMGGIIIGHEVARALGVPFLFTERDADSGRMTLRRGFEIAANQRTIVIEDVITTGGSTREVIDLVHAAGARTLAAASIIDRSNGRAEVGVPRVALEQLEVVTYNPSDCPFCRQGLPVVKPGSRKA
jgi:orotate phosphoribosyltransferase